jgi:hypothetical protein
VLDEFQCQFGDGFLHRMGSLIFDKVTFPPGIDTIEKAMASVHPAYMMNHSNAEGRIGGYHWTLEGRSGLMVCDNPYPCSFDMGVLSSVAKRFAPGATVVHLEPERCRHHQGDACTYRVEW